MEKHSSKKLSAKQKTAIMKHTMANSAAKNVWETSEENMIPPSATSLIAVKKSTMENTAQEVVPIKKHGKIETILPKDQK